MFSGSMIHYCKFKNYAELSQTYLKMKISLTFTDVPSEGIPVLAVCTP
jgi:hypothetical protein